MNSCEWDLILLRSPQGQNDSAFWYAKSWRNGYENVINNVWFYLMLFHEGQMQKQDIICLEIKDRLLFIDMDYSMSVKNRTNQDLGY
jgi:hypothetical protein